MRLKPFTHLAGVFSAILLSSSAVAGNDNVLGQWQTLNDDGQPESLVEIYRAEDEVQGRIVKLYDPAKQDAVCTQCEGEQLNQPIAGLVIITGLQAEEERWVDGQVLDPETGSEYGCSLWVENGVLKLKAGIGFLTQTREWVRPDV